MTPTPTATLTTSALERFLRYVQIDTQSDPAARTAPSTAKQLVLLDLLVKELKELGLKDAVCSEHGVVMATIPATTKKPNVPVIGYLAHVDTSPETSGANVKPILHKNWQGGDIALPDDPTAVIKVSENPELLPFVGHDIVTASGTTLLGADDKSGVAAVMALAEHLVKHPEIPHGTIRLGFTPDEEIGHGVDHFDVKAFGAFAAYTLDSSLLGQLDAETFSADGVKVHFRGFNAHPGFGKGRLINSIKVAADFVNRLPKGSLSPETTEGREGFVHPHDLEASVENTTVTFIVRDFVTAALKDKEALIEKLARETVADWPGSSVTIEVTEQYRNMKEVLDGHPQIVENAREAIRRAGLAVKDMSIRGGTDGSRLSFMGLPTPNLFCGEHNFHSRYEWVCATELDKSVETLVHLAQVWEERA